MKCNYQQMRERFELAYSYSDITNAPRVIEYFKTNSFSYQEEDTYEGALNALTASLKENLNNKIEMQNNLIKKFDGLNFFEKSAWRIKHNKISFKEVAEARIEQLKKDSEKSLSSIKFEKIDESTIFDVNIPSFLNIGDELFVVVENHNELDLGIYKASVSRLDYYFRGNNIVEFNGELTIISDGEKYEFSFRSDDEKYSSCHTYHSIFLNKNEAVDYYRETVQTRIASMNKRLEDLEKFDNSADTSSISTNKIKP